MSVREAASVLVVCAHPDDETIASGALIAEFVQRGAAVSLLTATRGEQGEVVAGPLQSLVGTPQLVAQRERERDLACDRLGIGERLWLGTPPARAAGLPPRRYKDSGMRWLRPGLAGPAADVGAQALTATRLDEVVADMVAAIRALEPRLVIGDDASGGYGHPDHVRVHDAAVAACRELGVPFAELALSPTADAEWFDLPQHLPTVTDALRSYPSQLTVDGADLIHSGGQRQRIVTAVGLVVRSNGTASARS
ncbi:PIG-L family deacetylase [Microbacterium sp. STN6]|uniref:PIG-L deacetylase family protein n=1 Tax=Microbacterium sp. STN6 TaxID=2995588 RepID=UPI002260DAA4|nr:PIG-L family deacetylase [Microbacterium sp. STN6]MCX7521380.1 PIG-L family deacetylase [Microbacterium sp. STN6]